MGRRKGSKNKVKKIPSIVFKKGVKENRNSKGKIKKEYKNNNYKKPVIDMSKVINCKFLGYCKCKSIITNKDLINKENYLCPQCNYKGKVDKIKKVRGDEEDQPKSRKEYLDLVVQSKEFEKSVIPPHDEIDPNDIKVQE